MILYFLCTLAFTVGLCVLAFKYFHQQIERFQIKLDDGRGYFLICMLVVAFLGSVIAFYLGGLLGYNETAAEQGRMVVAILFNLVVALLSLTWGLMNFKEGERY
jgi:multisubunit Na+/H+ antiporter MnhB subunit